jgi:glutathione S-transferase
MLTIWGRLNSHNVKKVVWFAEELAIDYRRHDVGGAFGMDADYLAKNPSALIPTIEDGRVTLWESNAILRYLAASYGGERWWSADPVLRATGDRWMDWQADFAEMQRPVFLGHVRTPEDRRDHVAMAKSAAASIARMAILDRFLQQAPWLSGDNFGIGDIPMGVYAHTFFTLPIDRPALPAAERWYGALQSRPGYAANVMIPLS